jgi:hypothetical protein
MIIWIILIYVLMELRYLTGKYIISPIVGLLLRKNLSFILGIGRERYNGEACLVSNTDLITEN